MPQHYAHLAADPVIANALIDHAILLHATPATPALHYIRTSHKASAPIDGHTGLQTLSSPFCHAQPGQIHLSPVSCTIHHLNNDSSKDYPYTAARLQSELLETLPTITGKAPDAIEFYEKHSQHVTVPQPKRPWWSFGSQKPPARRIIQSDINTYTYHDPASVIAHLAQSPLPEVQALLQKADSHYQALANGSFPSKSWQRTTELTALPENHHLTTPPSHTSHFKVSQGAVTQGGLLTSEGFVSCRALIVHNEDTGHTLGLHIRVHCVSNSQAEMLHEMGKQPGTKHAAFLRGTYYDLPPGSDEGIFATVEHHIPGVVPHGSLQVTRQNYRHRPLAHSPPRWDLALDTRNGHVHITEIMAKTATEHSFHLMPEVFASKAVAPKLAMVAESTAIGAAGKMPALLKALGTFVEKIHLR